MRKMAKKFIVISLSLLLLVLSACSKNSETNSSTASEGTTPKGDKTLFVGITNPPSSLNPINVSDVLSQVLSSVLFESLFQLDDKMQFLPKLAESMETEDSQNYEIKLNPKAKWTDGEPFTAEDIVFTLELMANPKVTSTGLQSLSIIDGLDDKGKLPSGQTEITGVKIVDDHTLQIKTKKPIDPNYMKEKLGCDIRFLPQHVLKDADPEKLHQHPFMLNPNVSVGAFKFTKLAQHQYLEYEANPDYYRGKPKIDKLIFKIMPATNLVAQLQTGEVHMNIPYVGPLAIEDLEKIKNLSNVNMVLSEALNPYVVFFNMKNISDVKVREALVYAMDRQSIVDKLFKGAAEVKEGTYAPIHPYFNQDLKQYSFDPEKAKALLKEAGWDFNKVLDFAVPSGNKTREQMATILAENLRSVGVQTKVSLADFPTHMQKGMKHNFDLFLVGLPFWFDPDISAFYQTGSMYNFGQYSNPQMDAILQEGKNEADPEKRKVIYKQALDIVQTDLPMITIEFERNLGAISKKVKVDQTNQFNIFYNIQNWDIE